MSSEIVPIIDNLTQIVAIGIFLFAVFRALMIGRSLVNRVYRNRAFFLATLLSFVVVQSLVPDSWAIAGVPLYVISYFLLLLFTLVFIDNTILVALDMDFFHRNTLRWKQGRLIAYPVFIIDLALILTVFYLKSLSSEPAWALAIINSNLKPLVIISWVLVFVYSGVVVIVAARRTPDKPMRRFLALGGLLIFSFLVTTFISKYTSITSVDIFNDFLGVAMAYVSYLMVVSLSPTGKVEREIFAKQD